MTQDKNTQSAIKTVEVTQIDYDYYSKLFLSAKSEKERNMAFNIIISDPTIVNIIDRTVRLLTVAGYTIADLKQELLMEMTKTIRFYDPKRGDFPAIFYTVATRKMYTLCKTQYRKSYGDRSNNLISLDSIPVSIEDEEHPANAAVDDIINKETFHNAIDFIRQYLSPMELKIFKLWISNKLSGAVNYDEIEKLMPHSKKSKSQRRKQIDNTISRIKLKVKHFQPELQQIFNGNLPKDVVSYGQWVAFIRTHKGMRFSAPKTYK